MKKWNGFILSLFITLALCLPSHALNKVQLSPEYFPNPISSKALSNADIYVGEVDLDPEILANRKQVSVLQENGTIVAVSQPIKTGLGGTPVYNGSPVTMLVDGSYSLKVVNSYGAQVYYVPSSSANDQFDSVANVAALRALSYTPTDGAIVVLLGHTSDNDGGGGTVYYDASSVLADNNGTVFLQTGHVGAGRWIRQYSGSVSVKWFGATGSGTTDDAAAIIAAVASLKTYPSTMVLTESSRQVLFFPAGVYYITSGIVTNLSYLTVRGEDSILRIASGVTAFSGIGTQCSFEDIRFQGGSGHIAINTANTDASTIRVERCSFMDWSGNSISTSATSGGGTQLVISRCKWMISLGQVAGSSRVLYSLTGDNISFNDCWVSHKSSNATFYMASGTLFLNRMLGVPMPEAPGSGAAVLPAWVEIHGTGGLVSRDCRYGGEGSGATDAIVLCHLTPDLSNPVIPSKVSITGGAAYIAGGPVVRLFDIPNMVQIRDVVGLVQTPAIDIDPACPVASIRNIGANESIVDIKNNSFDYSAYINPLSTSPTQAREMFPTTQDRHVLSSQPKLDSLVLQTQTNTGSYTPATVISGITGVLNSDDLGVSAYTYTTTAVNAYFTLNFKTALNGLSGGMYTVLYDVEVGGDYTLKLTCTASSVRYNAVIGKGLHTIAVPFYFAPGENEYIGLEGYKLPSGVDVTFRKFKIFKGRVLQPDRCLVFRDSAAPLSGIFYKGDIVYIPPVPGGYSGSICTVAGSPGTWKGFGAIAP